MPHLDETNWLSRTELLIGEAKLQALNNSHILIVGLGGVGGTALEHLVRAGIGCFTVIDNDTVQPSNRNRQILALQDNENKSKALLAKERALAINPGLNIEAIQKFASAEDFQDLIKQHKFTYVVDAIDTLTPKIELIQACLQAQVPLVSAMGAGGKMDALQAQVADISNTHGDKLAKMLRKRIHKLGVYTGFKAVFSPEEVNGTVVITPYEQNKKSNVGTISYMPPMFGLLCAQTIIKDITDTINNNEHEL